MVPAAGASGEANGRFISGERGRNVCVCVLEILGLRVSVQGQHLKLKQGPPVVTTLSHIYSGISVSVSRDGFTLRNFFF